jgi:hypothetical protein
MALIMAGILICEGDSGTGRQTSFPNERPAIAFPIHSQEMAAKDAPATAPHLQDTPPELQEAS